MIRVYSWPTPNGHKVHIMLHECELEHEIYPVDIAKGEQFETDFLAISPNNRIPAIIDTDGPDGKPISVFETAAILHYLADKTGKFLPSSNSNPHGYYKVMEWVMWQMGGVGPMFGQVHHFVKYNKGKSEYSEQRYSKEAKRLYRVMDKILEQNQYIAGKSYSISDISIWPWAARFDWQEIDLNEFPNVTRWYKEMANRPAVQKGWLVPQNDQVIPIP